MKNVSAEKLVEKLIKSLKISLLDYKCLIKLVVEIIKKYKMIKKIMIYFKKIKN